MPWPLERSIAEMEKMYSSFAPKRSPSQDKSSNVTKTVKKQMPARPNTETKGMYPSYATKQSLSQNKKKNTVKTVKKQLPARPNAEMAELTSKLKETRMIAESVPKSIDVTDLLQTLVEVEQKAEGGMTEVEEAFKELEYAQVELKKRAAMKRKLDPALFGQAINPLGPRPLVRQVQTSPIVVSGNIYYKADLSLEQAEQLFLEEAREVLKKCKRWADIMPPAQFRELATSKRQPLNKVCASLYAMRQLLQRGREGWDLTKWSTQIFIEAADLMPALIHRLRVLASFECSGWLKEKAWVHAHEVQRLLTAVEKQKVERENWVVLQTEMAFGRVL